MMGLLGVLLLVLVYLLQKVKPGMGCPDRHTSLQSSKHGRARESQQRSPERKSGEGKRPTFHLSL